MNALKARIPSLLEVPASFTSFTLGKFTVDGDTGEVIKREQDPSTVGSSFLEKASSFRMTPKEIFEIVEPYASEALAQLVQMSPKRGPLETKGHILKLF